MNEKPLALPQLSTSDSKKIIGLKTMAYKDYIAARSLLNNNFLHQAVFLINTCIEKELKAYLFALGIETKKIHDSAKLLKRISEVEGVNLIDNLNVQFIEVISKIYHTRYYEDLQPGFNFVINKNKFLAELDYTYSILVNLTRIGYNEDSLEYSKYHKDIDNKNPKLFENNYILNNTSKEEFLNQIEHVYEFRIAKSHSILEVTYELPTNVDNDKFDYEGLKEINGKNFEFSQISDHTIHFDDKI